jgi:hypothetical protein
MVGVQMASVKLADAVTESRRLTERDHQVLTLLGAHRAMTAAQLARVAFLSPDRARHRTYELARCGMLARFRRYRRPGSAPWIYTLGLLGAAVLAAQHGEPLPKPADILNRVLRLHHAPGLDHTLGVNDFFTRLAAAARVTPGCALSQWWPESTTATALGGLLRPDGYGEWTEHGNTLGFFAEHDRGTETLGTLLSKIDKYAELAAAGVSRPVLIELPSAAREANLHTVIHRRHGPTGPPATLIATTHTTHPDATTNPAGPVWWPTTPAEATARRYRLTHLHTLTPHHRPTP